MTVPVGKTVFIGPVMSSVYQLMCLIFPLGNDLGRTT